MNIFPATREVESRGSRFKATNWKQKDWDMAQVVECLPNKHEALSSIPNTNKTEKRPYKLYISMG
jgi:hypothetical protein